MHKAQSPSEMKNLILAIMASALILFVWQVGYEIPHRKQMAAKQQENAVIQQKLDALKPAPKPELAREEVLQTGDRLPFKADLVHGSINLKGARLDDLTLVRYREGLDPTSPEVVLLSPSGATGAYFAEFGWMGAGVKTPGPDTEWKASATELQVGKPVTLSWDNGEGLHFSIEMTLDAQYMFTVAQHVENRGKSAVTLKPFGLVNRVRADTKDHYAILHEGAIGVVEKELQEVRYDALKKDGAQKFGDTSGWLGMTDKYWLTALAPGAEAPFSATFQHQTGANGEDRYQTDYMGKELNVAPGDTASSRAYFFAGPKEVKLLETYGRELGIPLFDRAIDFGVLYFLTKPIFHALNFFYSHVGNFGIAILILTVIIKLLMFPLAYKSYVAIAGMKEIQPQMNELREKFGNDKARFQQELMMLYRREKINPMSGCLPLIIQIPVFFALYKVLFVTIEMRHAPFYGWIHDLSAMDPTTLFNLFGLIHWTPPSILHVGAWPVLMCISMMLQQKVNPKPTDPAQEKVLKLLPFFFLFLLASMPSGLVIYWTWSNTLSIIQQIVIMRRVHRVHESGKPAGEA